MPKDENVEIDRWVAWREDMNSRHRTMTLAEYQAWCRIGDGVSHPSSTNALQGGLSIILGGPEYLGKIDGVYEG